MNKTLQLLVLCSLIFSMPALIGCKDKVEIEKFEKPHSLFFYNPNNTQKIMKLEDGEYIVYDQEIKESDSVELIGKTKNSPYFIVAKCPARLVNTCSENEILISDNNDTVFALETEKVEAEKIARDFYFNPEKAENWTVNTNRFIRYVNSIYKNEEDRLRFVGEVIILGKLIDNPYFDSPVYKKIFDKYRIVNKITDKANYKSSGNPVEYFPEITKRYEKELNQFVQVFPSKSKSFKGIVDHFNKLQIPYAKEKILNTILANSAYKIHEAEIRFFENKGEKFCEKDGHKKCDESIIESIQAVEDNGSIGFVIKFKDDEIHLTPTDEIPLYFLSCEPCLNQFKKSITGTYKDILKDDRIDNALRLIAIKFGKGGFDKEKGYFSYTLSSEKQYWMMFEIFRRVVTRKPDSEEFSGDIDADCGGKWKQPKGKLYVTEYSDCEGGSAEYEGELCMEIGGSEEYEISFGAIDEKSDKYKVNIKYDRSSDSCKRIMERQFNYLSR